MLPIHFDKDGLIPVVTQDASSGEVLMLAFMNEEAVRLTQETGLVHHWSRSRNTLWLKGETSGNRQQLISIHVNCEQNSLLLKVMQQGAVCHEGFDTCYYRSLQADGALQIERDRVFDPDVMYGNKQAANVLHNDSVREHFEAYEFLRDHDFTKVSSTSRRLRAPVPETFSRVSDELRELAEVLTGEHVHRDKMSDIVLESSQVLYWVYVSSLSAGLTWQQIRPDVALATPAQDASGEIIQKLLQQYATRWSDAANHGLSSGALPHGALSLVAQACRTEGIDPLDAVAYDLNELRSRSYLNDYFATLTAVSPSN